MLPDLVRQFIVERTGMRLFVLNSQFGQILEDGVTLDLELPSQLIDSNLRHLVLLPSIAARNAG